MFPICILLFVSFKTHFNQVSGNAFPKETAETHLAHPHLNTEKSSKLIITGLDLRSLQIIYTIQKSLGSNDTSLYTYTGCLQMNGAVSKVNKKFISHLTRAQGTPSAAATVQVSHALPAVR